MTDKQPPSLNLIERMAQRLAQQKEAGTSSGVIGAPSPVLDAESAARREPRINGIEAARPPVSAEVRRSAAPPEAVRQPASADLRRAVPPAAAPTPDTMRPAPTVERSHEVHLDFRVLRQNGMITPDNMSSVISNEFRGIKRKLLQKARDINTRAAVNNLVMVTSTLPGEGKTFTSMNLAMSLAAERGLQVLLVDADVIRPSVGNMFKSIPKEGLTDLLLGQNIRVSDIMCRCAEIPNLAVMFSGRAHADSPELISSGRMVELCKDLSSRYPDRIIVIDTPPVLASSEPATLASYVHQLIMVVAADQTDRHQLRKSLESVAACKNISLLFNKAPRWNEAEYTPYYGYATTANAAPPAASS